MPQEGEWQLRRVYGNGFASAQNQLAAPAGKAVFEAIAEV
jgi:hypothetical protein